MNEAAGIRWLQTQHPRSYQVLAAQLRVSARVVSSWSTRPSQFARETAGNDQQLFGSGEQDGVPLVILNAGRIYRVRDRHTSGRPRWRGAGGGAGGRRSASPFIAFQSAAGMNLLEIAFYVVLAMAVISIAAAAWELLRLR
jgi:hypothetical protein